MIYLRHVSLDKVVKFISQLTDLTLPGISSSISLLLLVLLFPLVYLVLKVEAHLLGDGFPELLVELVLGAGTDERPGLVSQAVIL